MGRTAVNVENGECKTRILKLYIRQNQRDVERRVRSVLAKLTKNPYVFAVLPVEYFASMAQSDNVDTVPTLVKEDLARPDNEIDREYLSGNLDDEHKILRWLIDIRLVEPGNSSRCG